MELEGKIAFITGAASGIGKAFANKLLTQGVKVFIADINETNGAATANEFQDKYGSEKIRFMKLDVANEDQFAVVFQAAVDAFCHVDIMVNDAGILNESTWQKMVQINLCGTMIGTKLAELHMRKDRGGRGGRIVNVSSIAALGDFAGGCALPVYTATKHAIRSFTLSQADQLDREEQGIDYAVLCPDGTITELTKQVNDVTMKYYTKIMEASNNKPSLHGEEYHGMMQPERIAEGLLDLLQLVTMNGAVYAVTVREKTFRYVHSGTFGTSYHSAVTTKNIKN